MEDRDQRGLNPSVIMPLICWERRGEREGGVWGGAGREKRGRGVGGRRKKERKRDEKVQEDTE